MSTRWGGTERRRQWARAWSNCVNRWQMTIWQIERTAQQCTAARKHQKWISMTMRTSHGTRIMEISRTWHLLGMKKNSPETSITQPIPGPSYAMLARSPNMGRAARSMPCMREMSGSKRQSKCCDISVDVCDGKPMPFIWHAYILHKCDAGVRQIIIKQNVAQSRPTWSALKCDTYTHKSNISFQCQCVDPLADTVACIRSGESSVSVPAAAFSHPPPGNFLSPSKQWLQPSAKWRRERWNAGRAEACGKR